MSRTVRALLAPVLVLALALGVAVAVAPGGARAAAAADGGDGWDPRIAPIAKEVERIRGLDFEHTVPVRFLSDKAFRKRVTRDESDLSKAEKRDIRRSEASLRALGLVSGDVDLFHAVNTEQGSDVLAFYDPDDKEVVVRGKGAIDASTRVTLAHELTHVLQDQHFDLNATEADFSDDTTQSSAFDALVEGDATWVEDRYEAKLSKADQQAYERAQDDQGKASEADTGDVPAIVDVLFSAPYLLGPHVVEALRAQGGRAALDRAFRNPPTADAQVLDPTRLLVRATTKSVPTPKAAKGEQRLGDPDEFGALGLYLVLASRIPASDAYAAASSWAGDREITVRDDGRICVQANFSGRTRDADSRLAAGLRAWAAAMPAGTATVSEGDGVVTLRSCDPGAAAAEPDEARLHEALVLLVERDAALLEALKADASPAVSQCFADALVAAPAFSQAIAAEVAGADVGADVSQQLQDAATAAVTRCRSGG